MFFFFCRSTQYHVVDLRIEQVNRFDNQRIIQGMNLFQDIFFSGGKSAM
jgi:hypothetical protein